MKRMMEIEREVGGREGMIKHICSGLARVE
jgi:hypothetical protein